MMNKHFSIGLATLAGLALSACGSTGLFDRERPDEFAVSRQAPLVVPPDFSLVPPTTEAGQVTATSASEQALEALFGGPSARSAIESDTISKAGTADAGIRSSVGDLGTTTIAKGEVTQNIVAAPQGDGQEARAVIP